MPEACRCRANKQFVAVALGSRRRRASQYAQHTEAAGIRNYGGLYYLPVLYAGIFLALALFWLYVAQPYEDAYILFKYARNLADTGVISFNPAGAHAEGATDFLYLVFVALLTRLGLDVAVSAAIVNTAGILALTDICARLIRAAGPAPLPAQRIVLHLFPALFLFTITANSAYGGFGTAAYAGLNGCLFVLLATAERRKLAYLPVLSILVALWRPDGVIIGIAATVIGFARVADRRALLRYLTVAGGAAIVGAVYMAARWSYFGHLLPLPLYVKTPSEFTFAELVSNLKVAAYLLPVLAAALILNVGSIGRIALALAPFLLHFGILLFALQLQNVAYRFQSPEFAAALLSCFLGLLKQRKFTKGYIAAISIIVVFAGMSAYNFANTWRVSFENQYMWNFHVLLSKRLKPQDRVIVTEAGRVPFFSNAKFYDAVGLNTPYPALHAPDTDWIRSVRPDIIMFHQAGTLAIPPRDTNFFTVDCASLWGYRKARFRGRPSFNSISKVQQAALYLTRFLAQSSQKFNCTAVRYQGDFNHIYALRRGHGANRWLPALLKRSFSGRRMSYFEAVRQARH